MDNTGYTAKQAKRRRRKYRLNKKKFTGAIIILGLIAALTAAAVILIPKRIVKTQETAAAFAESIAPPISEGQTEGQTEERTEEPGADLPMGGRVIVLDAGHGGFDPGAIGIGDTHEDVLNLAVTQYLKAELEDNGARVIMTRENDDAIAADKDSDMEERRRIIEQSGADMVVSIHMNSYEDDPDVCGPLVLFMPGSDQGKALAEAVQDSMNAVIDPDGTSRSQSLFILRCGNMPCILVECGYLSNAEEERKLNQPDYQQRVAKAVCDGVSAYFLQTQE